MDLSNPYERVTCDEEREVYHKSDMHYSIQTVEVDNDSNALQLTLKFDGDVPHVVKRHLNILVFIIKDHNRLLYKLEKSIKSQDQLIQDRCLPLIKEIQETVNYTNFQALKDEFVTFEIIDHQKIQDQHIAFDILLNDKLKEAQKAVVEERK